jgi:predicted Zn-dependent peptidase
MDSPSQRVDLLIDELLWPNHPMGRDIAGSKESVASISRGMIVDYLTHKYLPSNAVIAVVGDIKHQEVADAVNQTLGKWTNRLLPPTYLTYKEQPSPKVLIEARDTEQAHLCLGLPGLPILHPKRFTLDLLNVILGEGMSSRLFVEIRDNLGLAYSIYSYVDHLLDSGALTVCAGVEPGNLRKTVTATLEQVARFRDEVVSEAEVAKARELSKGRLLLRMEDSRNVNGWVGGQEILTNKIITVDEAVAIVDSVTAAQIRDVARELLVGERLRMAVVGPIEPDAPLEELLKL